VLVKERKKERKKMRNPGLAPELEKPNTENKKIS